MWGYRSVELTPGKEYGIELDANIIMRGISTWAEAEQIANLLNSAYQSAYDMVRTA